MIRCFLFTQKTYSNRVRKRVREGGVKKKWNKQDERGCTETSSSSNLAVLSSGNTLCFLIHYLNEINEINQMNVRWNPCSLFACLTTDCILICVCERVSVYVSGLSHFLSFTTSLWLKRQCGYFLRPPSYVATRPRLEILGGICSFAIVIHSSERQIHNPCVCRAEGHAVNG